MWGVRMPTNILPCGCENKYQDQRYGKGMRVHNQAASPKPGVKTWRCTVCLREQERGEAKKAT